MPRRGDYLFKRKGSQNWWIRLQYIDDDGEKRKTEKSLGTADRTEAEVFAAHMIKFHKERLLIKRAERKGALHRQSSVRYEPDKLHTLPDGSRLIATKEHIQYLDESGKIIRIEPNPRIMLYSFTSESENKEMIRLLPKRQSVDDAIIETWITHRSLNKHIASEARNVWKLFKDLTHSKPLKACTRDDARNLVKVLSDTGNKSQTVAKKLSHLCAAVNLAIDENKLSFNPFSNVAPKADDSINRLPLSDEDMELVRSHLHELRNEDQLLWKWLATTGMRLEEPFQIMSEYRENGTRYVIVGTKTATSKRRVPIPEEILPSVPTKIEGPLFTGTPETAAKRLRYFLKRLGISHDSKHETGDKRKVVHSLRHRAKDRLRSVRCPLDIQHELLGHEVRTVASGYGRGYPVEELKTWIDKIGY